MPRYLEDDEPIVPGWLELPATSVAALLAVVGTLFVVVQGFEEGVKDPRWVSYLALALPLAVPLLWLGRRVRRPAAARAFRWLAALVVLSWLTALLVVA